MRSAAPWDGQSEVSGDGRSDSVAVAEQHADQRRQPLASGVERGKAVGRERRLLLGEHLV